MHRAVAYPQGFGVRSLRRRLSSCTTGDRATLNGCKSITARASESGTALPHSKTQSVHGCIARWHTRRVLECPHPHPPSGKELRKITRRLIGTQTLPPVGRQLRVTREDEIMRYS